MSGMVNMSAKSVHIAQMIEDCTVCPPTYSCVMRHLVSCRFVFLGLRPASFFWARNRTCVSAVWARTLGSIPVVNTCNDIDCGIDWIVLVLRWLYQRRRQINLNIKYFPGTICQPIRKGEALNRFFLKAIFLLNLVLHTSWASQQNDDCLTGDSATDLTILWLMNWKHWPGPNCVHAGALDFRLRTDVAKWCKNVNITSLRPTFWQYVEMTGQDCFLSDKRKFWCKECWRH